MTLAKRPAADMRRPPAPRDRHRLATRAGGSIDLIRPAPAEVDLAEIADALGNICRFNGRVDSFYSVAQHSVMMARHASPAAAPYALMHDAAETVTSDIPTPTRATIALVLAGLDEAGDETTLAARRVLHRHIERRMAAWIDRHDAALHQAAGLEWPPPPGIAAEVAELDRRALVTERRDLMRRGRLDWGEAVETATPFREAIRPLLPIAASVAWMAMARECLPACSPSHRRAG